ncbi:MAG TPA: PSD1 and planctomycete cytochrome C domain-containing protein [Lacipirellula sp.]
MLISSSSAIRLGLICALAAPCSAARADEAAHTDALSLPQEVSFNAHIRPIFAQHCVSCHGGVKQASGLSLIYRETAVAPAESGLEPIVPGAADESYLIDRVSDPDPDMRMPPADHGPPLSEHEVALLRQWIDEGADWDQHWSFIAPRPQEPPTVERDDWPRDPLDRFVLAKLEAAGLEPAAEAARATWLRRVSLDLIGLPPSPEEYAALEHDNRPDAYERAVDRLLASPYFGERWASMWLDLARYADTVGFERDPHRDIWPYRDWVIRAFNEDMPFDEFTVKQLAGDLLPEATLADRLATAFHRNTQTNTEGGTDDEEYRTAAVLDRVATTWQTWLGSTFRCTQCHSHPYDPFTHEEYYKFVAFFNTSRDTDLKDDEPWLRVPNDVADWPEAQQRDARILQLRHALFERQSAVLSDESQWTPLKCDTAQASGEGATLVIRKDEATGASEVVAEGTVAVGSTFTFEFPLRESGQVAAVRIEALPKDIEAALRTPESGFVLSHLKGELLSADGAVVAELKFAAAVGDEADPLLDPADSLHDNKQGWGAYTRLWQPRRAVFILDKPVQAPPQARLRLSLRFNDVDSGGGTLYIQRARFAATSSRQIASLATNQELSRLETELAGLMKKQRKTPGTNVPVLVEQPSRFARHTYLFARGNWLDKEQEVTPGVPAVMPPLPEGAKADRLAMARWLVAAENPLTARVLVNRLWQELFGLGIVETAGDFGTSGTLPSHPALLDHLALRLKNEYGWSVKRMLRALVLSATYRQDATVTSAKLDADPRNQLLSRGPRTRLTAEMVRDQALVLSGRFAAKMFGPPVMPPQPEGVWRSVYNNQKWENATGEDRYRRAVYTYWKRTSGYPSMITFDMPSRDVCVARRIATNTPLQALVTLNDEAFIELAQGLARRMEAAGETPREQIAAGYRLAVGRDMPRDQLAAMERLYEDGVRAFNASREDAMQLAAAESRYALTIVANALLNLDELLTK